MCFQNIFGNSSSLYKVTQFLQGRNTCLLPAFFLVGGLKCCGAGLERQFRYCITANTFPSSEERNNS